jgi:hypothetical protein
MRYSMSSGMPLRRDKISRKVMGLQRGTFKAVMYEA